VVTTGGTTGMSYHRDELSPGRPASRSPATHQDRR